MAAADSPAALLPDARVRTGVGPLSRHTAVLPETVVTLPAAVVVEQDSDCHSLGQPFGANASMQTVTLMPDRGTAQVNDPSASTMAPAVTGVSARGTQAFAPAGSEGAASRAARTR